MGKTISLFYAITLALRMIDTMAFNKNALENECIEERMID